MTTGQHACTDYVRDGVPAPHIASWIRLRAAGWALTVAILAACGGGSSDPASADVDASLPTVLRWDYPVYTAPNDWHWGLPANVDPPRVPADNPMNTAKVDLGRHLFYEKRLAGNGRMACASCHQQERAFSDGLGRSIGSTGMTHPRNANALVNVGWYATLTWANPLLDTLEKQAPIPTFGLDPIEMGVEDHVLHVVLQRLRDAPDVDYPGRFAAAFPEVTDDAVTWPNVFKALAAFQRTMISVDSRYDRWMRGRAELDVREQNGRRIFESAQCIRCHTPPHFGGQYVSAVTQGPFNVEFHNIGLYNLDGKGSYPLNNLGLFEMTGNRADMGAFRAPTLRNIAVSAPYMHDGSVATLEEAVAIMAGGGRHVVSGPQAGDGRASPHKSALIRDQRLSAAEQADLVAFLKTLTDEGFLRNPALSDPFTP